MYYICCMIVKIKSENPNLLNILYKSKTLYDGIYIQEMKNGHLIGNVISDNQYDIFFQDTKYSYNEDMSNMLDQQSLSNPKIGLDISNNFFKHLQKPLVELMESRNVYADMKYKDIDNQECVIDISNVYIDSSWAKGDKFIFSQYFPQIKDFKRINGNQYTFSIKCDTVVEAINLMTFIFLMLVVTNQQPIFIGSDMIKKYIRILANVKNVPYFVIYLFKIKLLITDKLYSENKKELESLLPNLELTRHNNHTQRIDKICEIVIADDNDILDFGCGEFKYFKRLSHLIKDNRKYYAVDKTDYSLFLEKIKIRSKFDASFYTDIYDIELTKNTTVIFTEVLEHMGFEAANVYIEYLLNNQYVDKLIITTPNKDFNEYYMMDTEMRRDDHVIEVNMETFKDFINSIKGIEQYNVKFSGICDKYNGITPTSMAVIEKVKVEEHV